MLSNTPITSSEQALLPPAESMQTLIDAAMAVCDLHNDGPARRAEMRADCIATPHRIRRDLLEHFRSIAVGVPA